MLIREITKYETDSKSQQSLAWGVCWKMAGFIVSFTRAQ